MKANGREQKRQIVASGILLLVTSIAAAQSKADFTTKYQTLATYQVRPGMVMFVEFSDTGQVCEVTIKKDEAIQSSEAAKAVFSDQLADQLVDELAPVSVRGQPSKFLSPHSYVAGGAFLLKQDFQNVTVEKSGNTGDGPTGGLQVLRIIWTKRSCAGISAGPTANLH